MHSEAPSAPPAGPAVNGSLVAVTVAEVSEVGAKVAPWLCCFWGKLHKWARPPQRPRLPPCAG